MAAWQTDTYGDRNPHTGDLADGAYISLTRIILLSVVSGGIYWFYWMYRTWKQYRDHTGAEAHPVWHALTQLVPVYGFFRFHAHVRVFKTLMQQRGVPDTLSPAALVIIVVAVAIAHLAADELIDGAGFVIQLVAVAVIVGVMCHIQSNLNRYWENVDSRLARSARFGKGEILCIILGIPAWLFSVGIID